MLLTLFKFYLYISNMWGVKVQLENLDDLVPDLVMKMGGIL